MTLSADLFSPTDFMQVRSVLIRELGGDAAAAVVLARIHWRCEGPDATDGWWRGSYGRLAEETGLSVRQIQRILTKLRADGRIEAEAKASSNHDQTLSYRVVTTPKRVDRQMSETPIVPETQTGSVPHPNGFGTTPKRVDAPYRDVETTKTSTKSSPSTDVEAVPGFGAFWAAYPRKVGKQDAHRVFLRQAAKHGLDVILDGVIRMAHDPNLPEPEYIPHPTTWLARGGWDDDPYPVRTNSNGRPPDRPTATDKASEWLSYGYPAAPQQTTIGGPR